MAIDYQFQMKIFPKVLPLRNLDNEKNEKKKKTKKDKTKNTLVRRSLHIINTILWLTISKSNGTYDLLLSHILNIRFCDNRNARVIGCVGMI